MVGNGFVAVKKLMSQSTPLDTKFYREVDCQSAVRHRNIVRFIGHCDHIVTYVELEIEGRPVRAEVRERLFCMEYMPKGSLSRYCEATAKDETDPLSWHDCYEIIKGICCGLHHLHKERIIHLDLKPANILLDDDMVPKISDFGLSRFLREDRTRTITQKSVGTLGSMAPEYSSGGNITFKADIFSLGVIIERMVAGRLGPDGPEEPVQTVAQSWSVRDERTPWETLYNQVETCLELSKQCKAQEPKNRPSTKDILQMLDYHHSTANDVNIAQQVQPTITLPSRSLSIEWSHDPQYWTWRRFQESTSRSQEECAELLLVYFLAITGEIQTQCLSPNTGYTVYLVYRLASGSSGFHAGQEASIRLHSNSTINNKRIIETSPVSLNRQARGLPEGTTYPNPNAMGGGGGWMELKLAEFRPNDTRLRNEGSVFVDIRDENCTYKKTGLIVAGMECRPNTHGR